MEIVVAFMIYFASGVVVELTRTEPVATLEECHAQLAKDYKELNFLALRTQAGIPLEVPIVRVVGECRSPGQPV